MTTDVWTLNYEERLLTHHSGLTLRFRGCPGSANFGFMPEWIPQELSCLELARLMREGVAYYTESLNETVPFAPPGLGARSRERAPTRRVLPFKAPAAANIRY